MKQTILIILSFIMLLTCAGCGKKDESVAPEPQTVYQPTPTQDASAQTSVPTPQPTASIADFSLSCYADYPQVPDFGAINGYELDSVLHVQDGQTIYYYVAKNPDDISAEFWTNCERFKLAATQLGYKLDAPTGDGVMLYMTKCGDTYATLFFQQRRSEAVDFNEGTDLFLVNVETAAVHDA